MVNKTKVPALGELILRSGGETYKIDIINK